MYQLNDEDIAGLPKIFPERDYREFVALESLKALSSRTEPLKDEEFERFRPEGRLSYWERTITFRPNDDPMMGKIFIKYNLLLSLV